MKALDKLLAMLKPMSNPNVTTESLRVAISSTGVKLDLESLMTNERVKRQMSSWSDFTPIK